MGLDDKMRPEMETTHKDLYNELWDCPESFHMEANNFFHPKFLQPPTELGRSMGEAPKLAITGQVECTSATKPS